jgi:hypothetical protein
MTINEKVTKILKKAAIPLAFTALFYICGTAIKTRNDRVYNYWRQSKNNAIEYKIDNKEIFVYGFKSNPDSILVKEFPQNFFSKIATEPRNTERHYPGSREYSHYKADIEEGFAEKVEE